MSTISYYSAFYPSEDSGAMGSFSLLAPRSILPEYPTIEIRNGDLGHIGSRVVPHTAKRGTITITGGTWSIPSTSLGAGSATVNSSTGVVTLTGIVQSGSYSILYVHTDGISIYLEVNVTYFPATAVFAKTASSTSTTGVGDTSAWVEVISLTIPSAPAGRLFFNNFTSPAGNTVSVSTGSGTCKHAARLRINGTQVAITSSKDTVVSSATASPDFSELFTTGGHAVSAGTVVLSVELQRTDRITAPGTIDSMLNSLDVTIIAT